MIRPTHIHTEKNCLYFNSVPSGYEDVADTLETNLPYDPANKPERKVPLPALWDLHSGLTHPGEEANNPSAPKEETAKRFYEHDNFIKTEPCTGQELNK